MSTHKALVYREYGPPEQLTLEDVELPTPADNQVLVQMEAVSLNASDVEFLTGTPIYTRAWGPRRPKHQVLGSDISGRVAAVGKSVTLFKPGDAVFGDVFERWGGLAEHVVAPEAALLRKPDGLSFIAAAAIPQAGVVALQALRHGRPLQPGHRILINGAGGGAGTFAIQLAKHLGVSEVTAVDHTRKLDQMRALGADQVIDYTQEDFTRHVGRYDRIIDLIASHPVGACARALTPSGVYMFVGGPLLRILGAAVLGPAITALGNKQAGLLVHRQNHKDIMFVVHLVETGAIKTVIDRCYPLPQAVDAFRQLLEGRAFGKVVVTRAHPIQGSGSSF